MMQHAEIYSDFNKRTHKHDKIAGVLRDHRSLLSWKAGERVLDAGCGPGDMTVDVIQPFLQQDFSLLLGADVSPPVIEHALRQNATEKVTFQVMDIAVDISHFLEKPENAEGFDKIFSFYVMQWLQDLKKGVDNLYRLLKPGGEMLLLFPAERLFQKTFKEVWSRDQWKKFSKESERKIPPFFMKGNPCEEFKTMLQDTGFEIIKCDIQKFESHYNSDEDIKDLIESLDHDIDSVPAELRQQYRQDCYDVLVDMKAVSTSASGSGDLVLTQQMICALARKPA